MAGSLPKNGVVGTDQHPSEHPSTFTTLGEASASIVARLTAMRRQANHPLDRSA